MKKLVLLYSIAMLITISHNTNAFSLEDSQKDALASEVDLIIYEKKSSTTFLTCISTKDQSVYNTVTNYSGLTSLIALPYKELHNIHTVVQGCKNS